MTTALEQRIADRRRGVIVSFALSIGGGIIGWSLAFAGLGLSGLATGAAVTLIVLGVAARRHALRLERSLLLGYAFAFVIITWPFLWLIVGGVRSLVTGQSLGS